MADVTPSFRGTMSEIQAPPIEQPAPQERVNVPGWAAWTLRFFVAATAIFAVLQPVYAGLFLAGDSGMRAHHSTGHIVIVGLLFFQILAAVLVWRPGRGPSWPIWVTLVYFFFVEIQAGFGFARMLALHIPLGVLTVGIAVLLVVRTFSPQLRVRRSAPKARVTQ